jgi:long-chain acyl-CoA synthetase
METTDKTRTLNHLFFEHVARSKNECLLSWDSPSGPVVYSSHRFVNAVLALRAFLRSCGLGTEGERIAILSENRPEWHLADFAILVARHIVVPIYPTLSSAQIEHLLRHSGCRAAVISGKREWEVLEPMLSRLPDLAWIIHMDDSVSAKPAPTVRHISLPRIEADAGSPDAATLEQIRADCLAVSPGAVATIVYTSGPTATPKGVMLSHANIAFDLDACLDRLAFRTARQSLSVLPLAHVFERLLCYGYFRMGVPIAYGDPHQLKDLLRRHRPEVMGCVPRILEKIRDAIEQQVEALPQWKRAIGRRLLRAGHAPPRHSTLSPSAWLDQLLKARVHRQLGGVRYFICGGAWLDPAVESFIRGVGFTVLQGYGMTETSPVISLDALGQEKSGAVGRPLEGLEVRVGSEGEIETRGPHVMLGYYKDPDATARALRDGWLLTGDLGQLDEEGFLAITGRSKDILVLSNGKNVSCAPLERALVRSRLIQDIFVVGEGRNFTSALVVPHLKNVAQAAGKRGIAVVDAADALLDPALIAAFFQEIETHQAEFANFERVKRFCFLREEAMLDPELVTPTQKMRRRALERKYAEWIGRMYARPEPFIIPLPEQNSEVRAVSA